jgi:signal transduction histidine kinase/ligand-binding sensor domain-containing protein/AraC-like DNA-binding protein/ActR/RegA family two-component response regulator
MGSDDFFFSHLGVENGLSQVSVMSIFQDSNGFLWFGTRNGLNKYNGYEFKVFHREAGDSASLSGNRIYAIAEDRGKNIWVATNNGVNCIDYQTEIVTRFYLSTLDSLHSQNIIYSFLKHNDGELYSVGDYMVFQCATNKTVKPVTYLQEIKSTRIQAVTQDANGDIYVGTEGGGLYVYSSDWRFRYHLLPGEKMENPALTVTTLAVDKDGLIWIGTEDHGLYAYDKQTRHFGHWDVAGTGLSNNTIRALTFLTDDSLLIGTFGGLNVLNKKDMRITPQVMKVKGFGRLSHYSIHSLLVDKDCTVWVGTYSEGINYYSPYYNPVSFITTDELTGIIGKGQEDKDGNMWFATEGGGLLYYNPQTGNKKLYPLMPLQKGNYEKNIIKYILLQGDSIYCATHFGSVYLFSIPARRYTKIVDFEFYDVYSLYSDSLQRLWIPTRTSHHLARLDRGKIQTKFRINGEDRPFRWVTIMKEWKPGIFLFGTSRDSIYLYDEAPGAVENLTPSFYALNRGAALEGISSITQDDSALWVSTTGSGLFRCDREMRPVKHYRKEDGLPDNHISSVTIDGNGDVWVATQRDIYKLNRADDSFSLLHSIHIPRQEYTLYAGSAASDGTLYFPGNKGVLAFNPLLRKNNPNIPPLYINSFTVHERDGTTQIIRAGELQAGIGQAKPIRLSANRNNITITYTALNYIHPEENRYIYRLDGNENNWHTTHWREANYNNLPPGKYTFRVKAVNNDGVMNPQETALHFVVTPPFYRTWWAYSLYVAVLTLSIVWIFKRQYRKMEQKRLNEIQEERMRMFTNFSHELRTHLTLLVNPLNDLQQRASFSFEVKQLLQLMKKNTERMLLLVNDLMDIQKYEAGKTVLQKSAFDFPNFVNEVYRSFESVAQNRKITFLLQNELPGKYTVYCDEKEIEKVFFNLLSNAFKFTPSQGTVSICISHLSRKKCEEFPAFRQSHPAESASYLYIRITDTGTGFDPQEAQKIFEPFYISKPDIHQQIPGTGIGLSLTRSIVLQHRGCIWAESSPEAGSSFMLLLPGMEKQEQAKGETKSPVKQRLKDKTRLLLEEVEAKEKPILLLVDDNEDILQYMEEQLRDLYAVQSAADGVEAFEKTKEKQPHIIVSDVVIPKMNGIELCRQIKAEPDLCHIPVILITGNSQDKQAKSGLEAGADDYIVKPFDISLLKIRIKNLLTLREKIKDAYGDTPTFKSLGIEKPGNENDFLLQYVEIIRANISNPDFDIAHIYDSLGMSRANFYRKVKVCTGLSPIELIRNIRLEAGAKLLRESTMNVSEIAQYIGFGSRSYFTRNFKEAFGVSPTEYQNYFREDGSFLASPSQT